MKRIGDKKHKKNMFTDECTPMHTQSHNEIINLQVWRDQTLKLMYVCLTMQMFIWHKKNNKKTVRWKTSN